ncbi:DUF3734 domain-containing protein [Roseomonas sp. BN140053]|uniref:DUF3734 domain-containing protein n=1 Tax=Roseomonas sp. BN140053 TaxID=3391898 RepID=UPI0039EC3B07
MPQREADTTASDEIRVLVLQGGGALGSYQAGAFEALDDVRDPPRWIAGVSIGAINAALIAGNPPELRVPRLREFWNTVTSGLGYAVPPMLDGFRSTLNEVSALWSLAAGAPGFFLPRFPGPLGALPGTPAALSFYDTAPLRATLERLVDFGRLNSGEIRLSVGAVELGSGNSVYFDTQRQQLGPEHIMASGALPPGFPPVEIEGKLYWDGGLLSNTPLQYVLDVERRRDLLVLQVDLFSASGPLPRTVFEAAEREKDIRFSSRTRLGTDDSRQIRETRATLRRLLDRLPPELATAEERRMLQELSQQNTVTVLQLIYRRRAYESHSKDYEFSRLTMLEHWEAGFADVSRAMRHRQWIRRQRREGGLVSLDLGKLGDLPLDEAPGEVAPA